LRDGEPAGLPFLEWVDTVYDTDQVKREFLESGGARLGLDRVLRRE